MLKRLCRAIQVGVLVGLSPFPGATRMVAQSTVVVPRGAPVDLDGTWVAGEWIGPDVGDSSLIINFHEAEGYVQIGIRSAPLLVASLCLARADTVEILHASSALGRARYVRQDETWVLREGFEWRARSLDLGPQGSSAREVHRRQYGWVATTTELGRPEEAEFQVSVAEWRSGRVGFAVGVLLADSLGSIRSWPMGPGPDGCGSRAVVAGPLPTEVQFAVAQWLVVERMNTRGAPGHRHEPDGEPMQPDKFVRSPGVVSKDGIRVCAPTACSNGPLRRTG